MLSPGSQLGIAAAFPFGPQRLRRLHTQCTGGGHDAREHAHAQHEHRVTGQRGEVAESQPASFHPGEWVAGTLTLVFPAAVLAALALVPTTPSGALWLFSVLMGVCGYLVAPGRASQLNAA